MSPHNSSTFGSFQSTLPRGERPCKNDLHSEHLYFNPRSCEGSDFCRLNNDFQFVNFNPRSREGSDAVPLISSLHSPNFNPRSREGSDMLLRHFSNQRLRFQSTLPRGERRVQTGHWWSEMYFNPRSREGSDIGGALSGLWNGISIHAPARGATGRSCTVFLLFLFQSTLPRGERQQYFTK